MRTSGQAPESSPAEQTEFASEIVTQMERPGHRPSDDRVGRGMWIANSSGALPTPNATNVIEAWGRKRTG